MHGVLAPWRGLWEAAVALEQGPHGGVIGSTGWLDTQTRKYLRALHRFHLGALCKGDYLLVTLTTPVGMAVDLHHSWRKFLLRLSRRGLKREYFAVREFNKAGTAEHLHVVFRAGFLDVGTLREQWLGALGLTGDALERMTGSREVWTHHDRVTNEEHLARYLGKYLAKGVGLTLGGSEAYQTVKQHGFWYSRSWIVRGWCWLSNRLRQIGFVFRSCHADALRSGTNTWKGLEIEALMRLQSEGFELSVGDWQMIDKQIDLALAGFRASRRWIVEHWRFLQWPEM